MSGDEDSSGGSGSSSSGGSEISSVYNDEEVADQLEYLDSITVKPSGKSGYEYPADDENEEEDGVDNLEYSDGEDEGYASSVSYSHSEDDCAKSEDEHLIEDISTDISERRMDDPKPPLSVKVVKVDVNKLSAFQLSKHKDIWMKTWPKHSEKASVNVYGYFHEKLQFGGHAVIVRDMSAKPIVASAQFSLFGQSYIDHVLMGIEDGLKLASEHGCSSPNVLCNSRLVVQLLNNIVSDSCRCEIKTGGTICETCTLNSVSPSVRCYFLKNKYYLPNVESSLEAVQGLRGSSTFEWDSRKKGAAHYLAKRVKGNAECSGSHFFKAVIEEPKKFPYGLVDILLQDACDAGYYKLDEEVSLAPTGRDEDMEWHKLLRELKDLRYGNAIVVEANGSNSITSNAEKGQGGDDVASEGVKNGGKTVSASNSIANAVVSTKGHTNTTGTVIWNSVKGKKENKKYSKGSTNKMKDGKAVNPVEGKKKEKKIEKKKGKLKCPDQVERVQGNNRYSILAHLIE